MAGLRGFETALPDFGKSVKIVKIALGFAVLVLSPRVCAHFLEAQPKKSVFETFFFGLRSSVFAS